MSDTRLPWRDSRATIYSGIVTREASKGMLHPILFEFTRETLARMGRAIRETWWSHRARTRSFGRRDARGTGRLLSRYCSMYNNLGAAHSDGHRPPPLALTVGNLIPRGGGGRERGKGEG